LIDDGSVGIRFVSWRQDEWRDTRTVLVSALADSAFQDVTDSGTRVTTLRLVSQSTDPFYNTANYRPVTVTTVDNDKAALIIDPATGLKVFTRHGPQFTRHGPQSIRRTTFHMLWTTIHTPWTTTHSS
jgi:hypothetical protein